MNKALRFTAHSAATPEPPPCKATNKMHATSHMCSMTVVDTGSVHNTLSQTEMSLCICSLRPSLNVSSTMIGVDSKLLMNS